MTTHSGSMRKIDFTNPTHYESLFMVDAVRKSTPFDWKDVYFERREESAAFETSEHRIDGHYLMVKLSPWSIAERCIDGKWHSETQRRGSMAYVPDDCTHLVRYRQPLGTLCLLTLSRQLVESVAEELNQPVFRGRPRAAQDIDLHLLNSAECLDQELRDGNPNGLLFAQNFGHMIAAHLVMGFGTAAVRQRSQLKTLPEKKRKWLDEFIDANLSDTITIDALARQVGLSPYHFSRLFKNSTGMAPYKYVLHRRMAFAQACLRDDHSSIADISLACGFNDATQFTKQFRKICGQTPSQYRHIESTSFS
ncbi:HTH-type transcriptional activator RhaR [bioreactor metagenome]|uniref:HTH-type transcriptional activator RhaR n=1 Tax=bioreactor metagenome TaxID=1076179 RepID=A0A645BFU2_9ZZZZ